MKKIILTGWIMVFVCCASAYAQDTEQKSGEAAVVKQTGAGEPVKRTAAEKAAAIKNAEREVAAASRKAVPVRKQNPAKSTKEQLIDLDLERSMVRIDELERRISAQDREMRSLNDKIRSLDRDVDDLKRRLR